MLLICALTISHLALIVITSLYYYYNPYRVHGYSPLVLVAMLSPFITIPAVCLVGYCWNVYIGVKSEEEDIPL